jgi:predicted Zn-dependent protease
MGAKTFKRLAILVTATLIAGLAIFFLQRYQVDKMDRRVLDQADSAGKEKKFDEAAQLYQEHLEISPDDQQAKLKYADTLLKEASSRVNQLRAVGIYLQYVNRFPADTKARRRLAELLVDMEIFGIVQGGSTALELVDTLRKSDPEDGSLNFLRGRCLEGMKDPAGAVKAYGDAIANNRTPVSQRVEAYARTADLLRSQPETSKEASAKEGPATKSIIQEADTAIQKMVELDSENYRVYLERGSYFQKFGNSEQREIAKKDLLIALQKNPRDPKVYRELAILARSSNNDKEARRVIEEGLKVLPAEPMLHVERASLELPGSIDKAIKSLRHSVDLIPGHVGLRLFLAELLAQSGVTSDLLKEIGELKRMNLRADLVGLFEAKYLINSQDWTKAISTLVRLQPELPEQKAQVSKLLAVCYRNLASGSEKSEALQYRVREREALEQAIKANPRDVRARVGLIENLVNAAEIERALSEYHQLPNQLRQEEREAVVAAVRVGLVRLLIARNQQRPVAQQDWTEVENLIKEADPKSNDSTALQTEMLTAQGKIDDAGKLLEAARSRKTPELALWLKSAEVLRQQGKLDDAAKLLDEVQKALGDSLPLRIQRSLLLLARGSEDLPRALGALAENTSSFSPAEHRRLLEVLAQEAAVLADRSLVTELWTRIERLDPNVLVPHLQLFELALRKKDKAVVELQLNEVKRIDGSDGPNTKLAEAKFTNWQAENTADRSEQAKLRDSAELQLRELMLSQKRGPQIPYLLAELTFADLTKPGVSAEERKNKANAATDLYLEAIRLGRRDLDTLRRASDLLYFLNRKDESTKLWTELGTASTDLLLQAATGALRHNDRKGALDLAQKAKAANPGDPQASLLLAQMLMVNQRFGDAETELRETIAADPLNSERWSMIIEVQTQMRQWQQAEKSVHDAEAALKGTPIGPGRCCEVLGRAYKVAGHDERKSQAWLDEAGRWYLKAYNDQKQDLNLYRLYVDFLVRRAELSGKVDDRKTAHDQIQRFLDITKSSTDPQVLQRRPDYVVQLVNVLFGLYQIDQRPELLNEIQVLLVQLKALRPDALDVLAFEARLLKARNQIDDAVALIQAASKRPIMADTRSDQLWMALVKLAEEELGRGDLAAQLLGQRLQESKSSGLAIILASLLERLGRFQEAEAQYRQCLEKRPDDVLVLNNLAWLMALRDNDTTRALDYLNRAIKLSGPRAELLDTRGVIYTKLRQGQDAITDLTEAIKQEPSGVKYFHLAQAYLQAGKKPDAKKSFDEARAKGLLPNQLHPLEGQSYQQLVKDLGIH